MNHILTLQNQKTKDFKTIGTLFLVRGTDELASHANVVEYPLSMCHFLMLFPEAESQTSGFRIRNGGLREMPLSDGGMLVESTRSTFLLTWPGGVSVLLILA